jgi:hypothetical protein
MAICRVSVHSWKGLEVDQLKRPKRGRPLSGLLQLLSLHRDGREGRQRAGVDGILLRRLDDIEGAKAFLGSILRNSFGRNLQIKLKRGYM